MAYSIILIEASIWNRIINKHSLLRQSTWFPLFFFLLLSTCRPSLVGFYPALVASFFLVLSINRLFSSYMKEKALSELFDTGFFIGIATLFYLPAISFIIFIGAGLFTLRTLNWRDWIVSLIGFLLPFLFTYTYNLVFYPNYGWFAKISNQFTYHKINLSFSWEQILVMVIVLFSALLSLWFFVNKITENVVKAQKAWSLMVWFSVASLITFILSPVKDSHTLSVFIIPGSFILSAYFLKTKARLLPELLFISLLGAIAVSLFL